MVRNLMYRSVYNHRLNVVCNWLLRQTIASARRLGPAEVWADPVMARMYVLSAAPKMNQDAFETRFAARKVTTGGNASAVRPIRSSEPASGSSAGPVTR